MVGVRLKENHHSRCYYDFVKTRTGDSISNDRGYSSKKALPPWYLEGVRSNAFVPVNLSQCAAM